MRYSHKSPYRCVGHRYGIRHQKITLPLTFQLEVSSLRVVSLSRRSESVQVRCMGCMADIGLSGERSRKTGDVAFRNDAT